MPFRIGPLEVFIILVIILVIFGVGRLPEVGSGLGKGIKEFRQAIRGEEDKGEENSGTKNAS